jgi:hypothetical protein
MHELYLPDVAFVVAWELSATPEEAAAALKRSVESVVTQANFWRRMGVHLKAHNEVAPTVQVERATNDEQTENVSYIVRAGIHRLPHEKQVEFYALAELAIQSAQQHALGRGMSGASAVAGGDLDDFVTENLARTYGRIDFTRRPSEVRSFARLGGIQAAKAFFTARVGGATHKFKSGLAHYLEDDPAGREPDPAEAITSPADPHAKAEEHEVLRREQLDEVKDLLPFGRVPVNYADWQAAGLALGMSRKEAFTASWDKLPRLVADLLRAQLMGKAPAVPPLSPPPPPKREPSDGSAEHFVRTWETSTTVDEVATKMNRSKSCVRARARYLTNRGVKLKHIPSRFGRRAGVQAVMALAPCRN